MSMRLLLHRLSLAKAEAELLPTTAEALRTASFIDGRTDIWCGPAQRLKLEDFLASEGGADFPVRMIFNIGFCGSTLLARLLDVPGRALVLREPNCLADLANQRAAADLRGEVLDGSDDALAASLRHLSQPWRDGEEVLIKPSNWANNLLASLSSSTGLRPIFLTCGRESFVTAIFRGGPERVAFAARAAVHLSSAGAQAATLVAAALHSGGGQLDQLARLAATLHEIQLRAFRVSAAAGGWGEEHWVDFAELLEHPSAAAGRAAEALGVKLPPAAIDANAAVWAGRHAKDPQAEFSRKAESDQQGALEAEFGATIRDALEWASGAFNGRG